MTLDQSGIIIALDLNDLDKALSIVQVTHDIKGVNGYKIGFSLGLGHGLPLLCKEIRKHTDLPIIYDHQKAATDIPDTASIFVKVCKDVDAIILFPQSGPDTLAAWIDAVRDAGKIPIVGGEMTHHGFLSKEGGFLKDDTPERIYALACQHDISHFVVPGNKPNKIEYYRELLHKQGVTKPTLYSPGLITQGGDVEKSLQVAGENWQAIIGRAIINAEDPRKAAEKISRPFR